MTEGSFNVANPVSDEPMEVPGPRLAGEYIKVGQFLWYESRLPADSWSCPAVVVSVDVEKNTFRLMTLDDFTNVDWDYPGDVDEHSDYSRQTMRVVTEEKVQKYLKRQRQSLDKVVADAEAAVFHHRQKIEAFNRVVEKLNLQVTTS